MPRNEPAARQQRPSAPLLAQSLAAPSAVRPGRHLAAGNARGDLLDGLGEGAGGLGFFYRQGNRERAVRASSFAGDDAGLGTRVSDVDAANPDIPAAATPAAPAMAAVPESAAPAPEPAAETVPEPAAEEAPAADAPSDFARVETGVTVIAARLRPHAARRPRASGCPRQIRQKRLSTPAGDNAIDSLLAARHAGAPDSETFPLSDEVITGLGTALNVGAQGRPRRERKNRATSAPSKFALDSARLKGEAWTKLRKALPAIFIARLEKSCQAADSRGLAQAKATARAARRGPAHRSSRPGRGRSRRPSQAGPCAARARRRSW